MKDDLSRMESRVARPEDLGYLLPLIRSWRDTMQRSFPDDATLSSSVLSMLESGDAEFLLAIDESDIGLGFVQQRYRFSLWLDGLEATLEDLFVSPDSRKKGVGAHLVQFAIARAQAKGCRSIKLDTNDRNRKAIRLYEKMDFVSNSTRFPDSHQLSFEKGLNSK